MRSSPWPTVVLVAVIGIVAVGAWWNLNAPNREIQVPIIIYLVDTLRADRLSAYGYERPTSPQIEKLAAESVLFERAYAPAAWTLPSVTSLMTSTFSCEHGMVLKRRLNPEIRTLAERLGEVGYFTAGAYNNVWVGPVAGLDRGYDRLIERTLAEQDRSADVDQLLTEVGGRPFLMYLHTMEPHDTFLTPYEHIAPFGHVSVDARSDYQQLITRYNALKQADWIGGRPVGTTDNTEKQDEVFAALSTMKTDVEVLYDAAVNWADANLGRAVRKLIDHRVWDDAIFVFLSDHGEELDEHGGWLHSQSVYEELVRVPLLIRFPGGKYGGRRVRTPVSLVDVMPTILDYIEQAELCNGCQGSSLMPLLDGPEDEGVGTRRIPSLRLNKAFYYRPIKQSRGDLNIVVRQDRWKGIWNEELNSMELYDLERDPDELVNAGSHHADLVQEFSQSARRWLANCEASAKLPNAIIDVDEEIEEKLRALGYFH